MDAVHSPPALPNVLVCPPEISMGSNVALILDRFLTVDTSPPLFMYSIGINTFKGIKIIFGWKIYPVDLDMLAIWKLYQ